MFLAEAPLNQACQIIDIPDSDYVKERGLKIGTILRVLSRSSYGTMKILVENSSSMQFRKIVAEKIQVSAAQ
jgi:hypothetical protein